MGSKGEGRLADSNVVMLALVGLAVGGAGRSRGFEALLDNGASVSGGEMKGLVGGQGSGARTAGS